MQMLEWPIYTPTAPENWCPHTQTENKTHIKQSNSVPALDLISEMVTAELHNVHLQSNNSIACVASSQAMIYLVN